LDLKPDLPTLLVFGGSKGARSINRALLPVLPELLNEMQVIHVSGSLDWVEAELAKTILSIDQTSRYRAYPYLHDEMGAALKAADLVISRAGAASLGEYPLFGIPAVLVPYPHAWRYQHINARYLEKRGAAVVVADEDIPARLLTVVRELMHDEPRREAMGQAMRSLARPEAAESIASLLHDLVASSNLNRK
jgi:UDP-N-acetylglucosamine--N-acetylmuramyl-(pentapeptide) pyrophosphoryl-undecaprenol N-acetylglucosamine transferase